MKILLALIAFFPGPMTLAALPGKCLADAKLRARVMSARQNHIPLSQVKVESAFFHSESRGVLYYGIHLNNGEAINVGLRKRDCSLARINYVTDSH